MTSAREPSLLMSRLKFRVVQPVDIPRCHQLECLAYPETAASKSTLQHRQHHAAPFFRCVLLKKPKEGTKNDIVNSFSSLKDEKQKVLLDYPESGSDRSRRKKSDDEACHHVHHSPSNELIGYICATRCLNAAPTTEFNGSASDIAEKESTKLSKTSQYYPYPTKHEPNGRHLVVHSIVVQKEYQRLGVARALLEYYIKSMSLYNAELDEAGINRRRNKIQAKNPDTKIERIALLSYSSMSNLFVSAGFRWISTLKGGIDPLYVLERDVESSLSPAPSEQLPNEQPYPLMEQPCFIVDAFANQSQCGSGNPAAIVVLQNPPTKLIAECYNSVDAEAATKRSETFMQSVAKEFNQPATAFVWPIDVDKGVSNVAKLCRQDSSSISDDDESSNGPDPQSEFHYFIRFYTKAGIEVDRCAHANLAAASVLFRWYTKASSIEESRTISFHSRKDAVLRTSLVPPPPAQVLFAENLTSGLAERSITLSTQIEMECPWRTVEPMPPCPEGQGAVLAMLRRSFFRAWSVAAKDEEEDIDTDELAFSLSVDHVLFIGVTSDGEDLFIELSVDGFNMISERSVDNDSLKQGLEGKGVIICCEAEKLDKDATSEGVMKGHVDCDGANRQDLLDEVSIDFCSRYFQPSFSTEDPVSGWPHCALGPWFGARRDKKKVVGLQSSERGGIVECILKECEQKVCIVGSATTTIAGKTLTRA